MKMTVSNFSSSQDPWDDMFDERRRSSDYMEVYNEEDDDECDYDPMDDEDDE